MANTKTKHGENELGIEPRLLTTEQRRYLFRKYMEEHRHDPGVLTWDEPVDNWPNLK